MCLKITSCLDLKRDQAEKNGTIQLLDICVLLLSTTKLLKIKFEPKQFSRGGAKDASGNVLSKYGPTTIQSAQKDYNKAFTSASSAASAEQLNERLRVQQQPRGNLFPLSSRFAHPSIYVPSRQISLTDH